MKLSDYVLQTFHVNIFSLAIAKFSIFKVANGNFKMAAKLILSRVESHKKKAHADISTKLGKNVHEHE